MEKKIYNYSYNFFLKKKIRYPSNLEQLITFCRKKYSIVGSLHSYNDRAIGYGPVSLKKFNKIIKFDIKKRTIEVQSGLRVEDLLEIIEKEKLIIKSLPGTKFATIGGLIANNTLGKHLHKSYIKDYVLSITILNKGKIYKCSRKYNSEIFNLTFGAGGATGVIIDAKFKLDKCVSENILVNKYFFSSIKNLKKKILNIRNQSEYLAIWVNFFSKIKEPSNGKNEDTGFNGILFYAKHLQYQTNIKKRKAINLPKILVYILNYFSHTQIFARIFNLIFFIQNTFFMKKIYNYKDFFFIQNTIYNWNHIFKKKGFFVYEFKCKYVELEKNLLLIKNFFEIKKIFPHFMFIKFSDNIMSNVVISMEIVKDKDFINKRILFREFTSENKISLSLTKDSLINKINSNTLSSNPYLLKINRKYLDKKFNSDFAKRVSIE